ncbi:unspecified product [Leishmania tarentolae]|uniref:Unspecified product n=1 Tax=Leishmania tarentolae TaxID=5689 RepID=A0A640KUB5_LEITA|nr:unspecified product [Leishmania tarentolae]
MPVVSQRPVHSHSLCETHPPCILANAGPPLVVTRPSTYGLGGSLNTLVLLMSAVSSWMMWRGGMLRQRTHWCHPYDRQSLSVTQVYPIPGPHTAHWCWGGGGGETDPREGEAPVGDGHIGITEAVLLWWRWVMLGAGTMLG